MKNFKMHVQSKLLSKLATTCLLIITAGLLTFIGCAPETMNPVSKKAGDDKKADDGSPPDGPGPPVFTGPPALVGPIYVAVGDGGKIALSKDSGSSWQAITSGITENLWDIATDGTNIVAVANTGAVVRSTNGGETWAAVVISMSPTTIAEIEYGNGVFAIMTEKDSASPRYVFYRSTDGGATWATGTIAPGLFAGGTSEISLVYDGSRFLAVGGSGDSGTIAVSTDGLAYTSGLGNSDLSFGSSLALARIANERFFIFNVLSIGSFTTPNIYQAPTGTWSASPWTTNRRTSGADTTTFPAEAISGAGIWISDVAHSGSGGVYAFVDLVSGKIMTSPTAMDGSFTLPTSPVSTALERIIFFNGKFVAAGGSGKIVNGDAAGTTWTVVTSGTTAHLYVGEATANKIVFAGNNGGIVVSSDGTTWEAKSATGNDTRYRRLVLIE